VSKELEQTLDAKEKLECQANLLKLQIANMMKEMHDVVLASEGVEIQFGDAKIHPPPAEEVQRKLKFEEEKELPAKEDAKEKGKEEKKKEEKIEGKKEKKEEKQKEDESKQENKKKD